MDKELYKKYFNLAIVNRIFIQRIRWIEHIVKIAPTVATRKIFNGDYIV